MNGVDETRAKHRRMGTKILGLGESHPFGWKTRPKMESILDEAACACIVA